MNKKITSSALAALMIAGTTSFTAFAAMASGTVVIGNKAFDLNYANASANAEEITNLVVAGGMIFVKDFDGNWIDNTTGETVNASVIPAVVYKGIDNKEVKFDNGDKDAVTTSLVASVISITKTGVDVAITAPEKDMLGATIVVKDNTGKTIEVKAVDIAAGDKAVSFEFVKAITEDMVGTWTVDGINVDFDQMAKLSAVYNADSQLSLYNALNALDIINVKDANIVAYGDALTTLKTTVTDVKDFTKVMIQNLVTNVNTAAITAEQEKVIVKAVTDAHTAGNQVALLKALQNDAFVKVNTGWVTTSTNGYMAKIAGTETTIKAIQTAINTSNDAIIKATYTIDGVDKAKLTASKALIATYATVDDKGVITDATIKAAPATIDIQLAIIDVLGATTPTNLKAKLSVLATLVNTSSTTVLDMTKYVDACGKGYITEIAKNVNPTVAEINTAIGTVNTAAQAALLSTVTGATDADKLLVALKAYPGIKQVSDSNKTGYWATGNVNFKDVTNIATMQTAVDTANIAAIGAATDADALLVALKVLELNNIVDANKDVYLTEKAKLEVDVATVKTAITTINTTIVEKAQVKAINEAKDATAVNTALLALGLNDYLNVPSTDRMFVAQGLFDLIPDAGFADLGEVKTTLFVDAATGVIADYNAALKGVNDLTKTNTIVQATTVLKKVGNKAFNEMNAAQQATIAENFLNTCDFSGTDGALKTPFRTLTVIIGLMK